jgi:hypothetical protein
LGRQGSEASSQIAENASILPRPDLTDFSDFLDEQEMAQPFVTFLENTAPRMAVCFISMIESIYDDRLIALYLADKAQYFWKSMIPDACRHDAATRHAAVALSILHQSLENASRSDGDAPAFSKYYTKAIGLSRERQAEDGGNWTILRCILLGHCELLMGFPNEGMDHIISASRVITEMQSSGAAIPSPVKNIIAPIINGFLAISQVSGPIDTQFQFPAVTNSLLARFEQMPTAFTSFAEAGRSLAELIYRTQLLQELGQPSDRHQATFIRSQANSWSLAFDGLRFGKANNKSKELRKFQLILLAQHRMMQLLLKSMPPESDTLFQHCASDFKIMLAQIQTFVIEVNHSSGIEANMRNVIPIHAGVIMPLFFIATHCRDPQTTYGSLDLLKSLNLTEGQWNNCFAYSIASKLVEVSVKTGKSKSKHGPKMSTARHLRPVSLKRGCGVQPKLQYVDATADEKAHDIEGVAVDDECCPEDLNTSWVSHYPRFRSSSNFFTIELTTSQEFSNLLRNHGFQGPIRSQSHYCDSHGSKRSLSPPNSNMSSQFPSPSLYTTQMNDSYGVEVGGDPMSFYSLGIQ